MAQIHVILLDKPQHMLCSPVPVPVSIRPIQTLQCYECEDNDVIGGYSERSHRNGTDQLVVRESWY